MDESKKQHIREAIEKAPSKSNIETDELKFDLSKLNNSTFKRIITYYDSITASPREFLVTALLSSISGAIGKNAYFSITDFVKIYLNIWSVLIGTSTITKKTTAINICTKELSRISIKSYNDYKKKYAEYSNSQVDGKNKKTNNNGLPVREYYIFPNDSTVESLTDILSTNERGLVIHSEFGGFLQQLNRSYSGDSKQFLTAIYDVPESYEISRATKQNTLIQKPYLSILGASTIDWIKENSTPSDLRTGFFARFIFSIRKVPDMNKSIIPLLRLKELTNRSEYYVDVRDVFDNLVSINSPTEITLDEDAIELHCNYDVENTMEMIRNFNESEISFKGRLIVTCIKFAGLIALTDKRTNVTLKDMEDAIQLTEYYKRNVERLLNREINQSEFSRGENRILGIIKSKNGNIQHSQLLQLSNLKVKELGEIITNLLEKELIKIEMKRGSANRSSKYYIINENNN